MVTEFFYNGRNGALHNKLYLPLQQPHYFYRGPAKVADKSSNNAIPPLYPA